MKTCSKCKEELSIDNFRKDKTKKDGLSSSCKSCKKKVDLNYYENNKESVKEKYKHWLSFNIEKVKEYQREYRNSLKDSKIVDVSKIKIHIDIKKYQREYQRKRLKEDSVFKFKSKVRNLINISFKNNSKTKKNSKTESILGCTFEEFKIHLENQFTEGMNWDNQGKWHLDHIIPMATAKTEEDVVRLNHYTNFQPLWAEDNFKKGSKI